MPIAVSPYPLALLWKGHKSFMSSIPQFKCCFRCGIIKPLDEFHRDRSNLDGFHSYCKTCRKLINYPYHVTHRAENRKRSQCWRKMNLERAREKGRRNYYKHIENNKQNNRKWRSRNIEYLRIYFSRRRARKRSLPDIFTSEQWQICLEYWNYCCAVCGKQLRDLFGEVEPHADHWIPLSVLDCPGTVATNMICLCNGCNQSKHNIAPKTWLTRRYGKRRANQILKRIEAYFLAVSGVEPKMLL